VAEYAKIFKAYDIRGIVPDQLDEDAAEVIGAAFARLTGAASVVTCTTCAPPPRRWRTRSAAALPRRAPTSYRAASARPTCSTTRAAASAWRAR